MFVPVTLIVFARPPRRYRLLAPGSSVPEKSPVPLPAEAPKLKAPPSCQVPSPSRDWSITAVLVPLTAKTPE